MNSASIPQSAAAREPAPNFDGLAHVYRWMELFTFGPLLQRSRLAFLADLAACRNALVLGDGDGRFTSELLSSNRAVRIEAVDLSSAMLGALLHCAGVNASRIRIHCADVRAWQPSSPPYDLVATHFFLDCLTKEEVGSLIDGLWPNLTAGSLWVVSEFAVPDGWFGQLIACPLIRLLYMTFGLLTGLAIRSLPDHAAALRVAGFTLNRRQTSLGGLLVSELWSAGPEPAIEIELREF